MMLTAVDDSFRINAKWIGAGPLTMKTGRRDNHSKEQKQKKRNDQASPHSLPVLREYATMRVDHFAGEFVDDWRGNEVAEGDDHAEIERGEIEVFRELLRPLVSQDTMLFAPQWNLEVINLIRLSKETESKYKECTNLQYSINRTHRKHTSFSFFFLF
jgi:hypothetical protein